MPPAEHFEYHLGRAWSDRAVPVPVIEPPSARELARRNRWYPRPVVLRGYMRQWLAGRELGIDDFVRRFGEREIAALPLRDGVIVYDHEAGVPHERVRLRDLFGEYSSAEGARHIVLEDPRESFPELVRDVGLPSYARGARWSDVRVSFAGGGTCTPIHAELAQNIFGVIEGEKEFLLVPPWQSARLHLRPFSSAPHVSPVDPVHLDAARHPRAVHCTPWRAHVRSGDALYFPAGWWHGVYTPCTTLAVSTWWAHGAWGLVQNAAALYKRLRGFDTD